MTSDEIRASVLRALFQVAPEADPAALSDDVPLREQLDLDSMDLLRFAIALHREVGVDVPEVDYPKLSTLGGCVRYLAARAPEAGSPADAP